MEAIDLNLSEYFKSTEGRGILATADDQGRVDAAVYARPKVIDNNTVAFIMRDRLTRANTLSNPHATYLFMEKGSGGYKGIRLFLRKISEEEDTERLYAMRLKSHNDIQESKEQRGSLFLVTFTVEKVLPLTATQRHVSAQAA